jgi:hypothetical protein
LISGKISVGIRSITTGLAMRIRIARTMNVYGRVRASRTIHMGVFHSEGKLALRNDTESFL